MADSEDDLTSALAELAMGGIAFTSEPGPGGTKIYVVDSLRLTEDEIILLKRKGSLTRDGLRHYLVDRAA
jgi:hypothetical protein